MADGLAKDGLTDGTIGLHMVQCGEDTNGKMGITREEQDAYAKQSYTRAMEAYAQGILQKEMFEVHLPGE